MNKPISNHAHAAKLIRAEMKRRGLKASVTSSVYSMGSSVHVDVEADLRPEVRQELEEWCGQFQQGHFDGMVDLYEYSNRREDIPQVKFVFVRVKYSPEAHEMARSISFDDNTVSHSEWLCLSRNFCNFWDRFEEARAAGGHYRSA